MSSRLIIILFALILSFSLSLYSSSLYYSAPLSVLLFLSPTISPSLFLSFVMRDDLIVATYYNRCLVIIFILLFRCLVIILVLFLILPRRARRRPRLYAYWFPRFFFSCLHNTFGDFTAGAPRICRYWAPNTRYIYVLYEQRYFRIYQINYYMHM